MAGNDLIFYGTTGDESSADGASQPDLEQWLGGKRASQVLHEFESTLTAAQATGLRHYMVDSSRIGDGEDVHALKWIAIQTGANALAAARVVAFQDATGTFELDRALGPGNAQIGDVYKVFAPNNVFDEVTAEEARTGITVYRCIVCRNQHGATLSNARIWLLPLDSGGIEIARAVAPRANGLTTQAFLSRPDEFTDPLNEIGNADPQGGANQFEGVSGWRSPFAVAAANNTIVSWGINQHIAIWLRRVIASGSRFRRSRAVQVIVGTETTGGDPDPLSASAILAWDVALGAITAQFEVDRYVHRSGGARVQSTVLSSGSAVVDLPVEWGLRPGDQGSVSADDDPFAGYGTTDANGDVSATFISPELEAADGTTSRVQVRIPSGEEVGDPSPRVTFAFSDSFSFAGTIEVTIPQAERVYLEDPGVGMEPSF